MCSLGVSNREWLPLEVKHKEQLTKARQFIQAIPKYSVLVERQFLQEIAEQQGEVETYV